MTYRIVRFRFKGERSIIAEGLTLEDALEHCLDPETSSQTCTDPNAEPGKWFDGYEAE
jgi:hypothetical protein